MKLFGKPLLIEAQGSFAAGGTVIREKGTYEEAHALSPEGQEKHVDHGYVFYQIPADARMLFFSCMAPGRAGPAGKLRRMAGKVFRLFFFVKATRCTSWTSQGGGEPEAAEWKGK